MSVVLSVDRHDLVGMGALLQSLWKHTPQVKRLRVYVVAVDMTAEAVLSYLACHRLASHQVHTLCVWAPASPIILSGHQLTVPSSSASCSVRVCVHVYVHVHACMNVCMCM